MGSGLQKPLPIEAASKGSDDLHHNSITTVVTKSTISENVLNSTEVLKEDSHHDKVETDAQGSEEEYFDIVCVACHRDGTTVEAFGYCCQCQEHLCLLCYKHHKKATPSMHHYLLNKDTMPCTQQLAGDHIEQTDRYQQQGQTHTSRKHIPISSIAFSDEIKLDMNARICVKNSKDVHKCLITGMTMLSPDTLVLVDRNNRSIKLVNTYKGNLSSQLSLTGRPWDITSTSSTQVAVTVPGQRQIQLFNVADKFIKTKTVKTNGKCYGICCYKDKLVVTFCDKSKLEILDKKGRVIASFAKDSTGTDIFNSPKYVQANSSYIFVSNAPDTYLIMLNWQGKVISRKRGIYWPGSQTLFHDESLVVCENTRVQHVSRDFVLSRIILSLRVQDRAFLKAICVDDEEHKLYISTWVSDIDDSDDNYIRVYEI